jgi:hypothetical protein
MPIFQGFHDRFRGVVAIALQEKVAQDIDRLIFMLLEAAIDLWKQVNWDRFNDDEDNCTVQVYRWCKIAKRQDARLALLFPRFQWVDVTSSMLEGSESVKSAKRPDLRVEIGEVVGRSFECKRLALTGGWCRAYVDEGLARFVLGSYGRGEPVGYMIGYVQSGTFDQLLAAINQAILNHPQMRDSDQLKLLQDNDTSSWSRSNHARAPDPIQIEHLMIELAPWRK